MRGRIAWLLSFLMMWSAGGAFALDGQLFAPAVDPDGYFSVYSSQTGPQGRYHLGVWYNFADDPLVGEEVITPGSPGLPPLIPPTPDETREREFIDELHGVNLIGSYSILDWLEVGIDVPLSYSQTDFSGVEEGFGIDDVQLFGKFRLLNNREMIPGLALMPLVDLPTASDDDRLVSDGEVGYGAMAILDMEFGDLRTALNWGIRMNDEPFADDDGHPDDIFYGLAVAVRVFERDHTMSSRGTGPTQILGFANNIEVIAEAYGQTIEDEFFESRDTTPLEMAGGFRFFTPAGLRFTIGAGGEPYKSATAARFRAFAAATFTPPPPPPPPPPAEPPPPPPEPQAKVVETDEQLVTLEPIFFDFDKSTIKPVSYPVLDQVAEVMKGREGMVIRVEGHTDSIGSDSYNQGLSQRRAGAVVDYLTGKGIDPGRLRSVGYGEVRPIATNETDEGRARNRRTEFHIVAK